VAYQRFEHRKRLRMSRRDLQDEFKQTEGDPQLKARLRSLRMERARRRMMAAVPDATVVVTNPTHYAVALSYENERMAAPRVVAKGTDEVALRIRRVAREHGVPVVENPPLARVLHAAVDLDGEVPPAHYRAVAEIIGRVMRVRAAPAAE
jgi:flagellar biosynthetic protein FlhB